MKNIGLFILLLLVQGLLRAQAPVADSASGIRIVDTLTALEAKKRLPILLQTELDSLVNLQIMDLQTANKAEPVKAQEEVSVWLWVAAGAFLIVLLLGYLLWSQQQKSSRSLHRLSKQIEHLDAQIAEHTPPAPVKTKKSAAVLAKEVTELQTQLEKLQKEKQQTAALSKESLANWEQIKKALAQTYKLKHYPGAAANATELDNYLKLLQTEKTIAHFSYTHFLKPLLVLADTNKNSPSRLSEEEAQKMLDCIVSMGLLYSEYLYLRIPDLALGGNMVARLGSLKNGNVLDLQLLKELNTEHGSRALVLKMALDKYHIQALSYPVFEETNLNLS